MSNTRRHQRQPVHRRKDLSAVIDEFRNQLHSDGNDSETVAKKPEVHEVGNDIVVVAKMDLNMCMLSCVYNSITTNRARAGFRAGTELRDLVALFQERTRYSKVDREEDGYTAKDMATYLKWLKQQRWIRSYTWKCVEHFTLARVFAHPETIEKLPATFILFGYTLPSDERDNMVVRFKKRAKLLMGLPVRAREKALVKYYDDGLPKDVLQKFQKLKYTHGVAVRVEVDHRVFVIDNKNRKWKLVKSMQEFGPNLLSFWACYIFDIEV